MTLSLLGKSTRSIANLNKWLQSKGCPQYAKQYIEISDRYDIRGDIALFQSCLETGYWRFGNDVTVDQNNFAGIGSTGGGVKGEYFLSPEAGIEAQIQNLALRAGRFVPRDTILSVYVLKNYDYIQKLKSVNWEDLSGTWAADMRYHEQIFKIMNDFDKQFGEVAMGELKKVSVLEFNRNDKGIPYVTAYDGSVPCYTHQVSSVEDFFGWITVLKAQKCSLLVAETDKKIIPKVGDIFEMPTPTPTKKVKVLLDPGHSAKKPGARSNDGNVKEEILNKYATVCMKEVLGAAGWEVDIYDPDPDDLVAIGQKAWTYDAAISFHHNSYEKDANPYHCIILDPSAPLAWKTYASGMCVAFASALDGTIADTIVFSGTNGIKGVYEAELSVLNTSAKDPDKHPPFHCLIEAYFLNPMHDQVASLAATKKAAVAIAEYMLANPLPV